MTAHPASEKQLSSWIKAVIFNPDYDSSLVSMINNIPNRDSLKNLPWGTKVFLRGDIDVPILNEKVVDMTRLESMRNTIEFCIQNGLIPLIHGHVGRDQENTSLPIAKALEDLFETKTHFIRDWFDYTTKSVPQISLEDIDRAKPGSLIVLENTRKYDFETLLWKKDINSIDVHSPYLHQVSHEIASKISRYYISDAIASSNLDWSSVVLPAYMDQVAISNEVLEEFRQHIIPVTQADVMIFSGLKMDKIDDLTRILQDGHVKLILTGGAIALALYKAHGILNNNEVSIGLAESFKTKGQKFHITDERIQQGKSILNNANKQGVQIALPIDFVLDTGSVSETIPSDRLQMDIGPQTVQLYQALLLKYVNEHPRATIYYNGALGKFEDERFANGTKAIVSTLKTLTDSGAKTYVGGGDGVYVLNKFGDSSWVTHTFTCGGTILKALSGRVISYLSSLSLFTDKMMNKK